MLFACGGRISPSHKHVFENSPVPAGLRCPTGGKSPKATTEGYPESGAMLPSSEPISKNPSYLARPMTATFCRRFRRSGYPLPDGPTSYPAPPETRSTHETYPLEIMRVASPETRRCVPSVQINLPADRK